ncbi:GtrA family protein [Brucella sp. NBRC 12950]|uniref:GtrA family protein n=1 Tax=Brucella sp. NBRC 12950 TaxID=2994518 RepID=UPI00255766A5|nr:GtrA family protein [Brucella sp. NBRC 12950]
MSAASPEGHGPFMEISGQFLRYALIGLANTAIHGAIMALLVRGVRFRLAIANLAAFGCAVTFSYFANSLWTFMSQPSWTRYLLFVSFMGCLAYATGFIGDIMKTSPMIVFISFTTLSLVAGFAFSRYFVFGA